MRERLLARFRRRSKLQKRLRTPDLMRTGLFEHRNKKIKKDSTLSASCKTSTNLFSHSEFIFQPQRKKYRRLHRKPTVGRRSRYSRSSAKEKKEKKWRKLNYSRTFTRHRRFSLVRLCISSLFCATCSASCERLYRELISQVYSYVQKQGVSFGENNMDWGVSHYICKDIPDHRELI